MFRVDIQLYQHEWNWENEKLYVFIQFRVFPTSTSVDITIYNIAFVNSER